MAEELVEKPAGELGARPEIPDFSGEEQSWSCRAANEVYGGISVTVGPVSIDNWDKNGERVYGRSSSNQSTLDTIFATDKDGVNEAVAQRIATEGKNDHLFQGKLYGQDVSFRYTEANGVNKMYVDINKVGVFELKEGSLAYSDALKQFKAIKFEPPCQKPAK